MRRSSRKRLHQYTIRSVPAEVDRAIRERARAAGASLNTVLVEALAAGVGIGRVARLRTDLDVFIGTWIEDPAFDEALAAQDTVDEELWR